MRIVHINISDIIGGASRAAYRLHSGLRCMNHDSRMIVKGKHSKDLYVNTVVHRDSQDLLDDDFHISQSFIEEVFQRIYIEDNRSGHTNTAFSFPYPGYDLSNVPVIKDADILNLHWVPSLLSPITLKNLFSLGKPIVWTLHDQWPFTGGCHYSAGCDKYKKDCYMCPQLIDDYLLIPHLNIIDKMELFHNAPITIVTPSKWLGDCAKESALFKNCRVEVIPNSIETDIFRPIEKKIAKNKLGWSSKGIYILAGAENGNEIRKGFDLMVNAIEKCLKNQEFLGLCNAGKISIVHFGNSRGEFNHLPIQVKSVGYIKSDELLALIYSASDFLILPSREDNLPNIMLEAMSCGTPVVAFNIGGMPDLVKHNQTGKIAPAFETQVLSKMIIEMINNVEERRSMNLECRRLIENDYSLDKQATSYLKLYMELIQGKEYATSIVDPPYLTEVTAPIDITMGKNITKKLIYFKAAFKLYKKFYKISCDHEMLSREYNIFKKRISYRLVDALLHPIITLRKIFK